MNKGREMMLAKMDSRLRTGVDELRQNGVLQIIFYACIAIACSYFFADYSGGGKSLSNSI